MKYLVQPKSSRLFPNGYEIDAPNTLVASHKYLEDTCEELIKIDDRNFTDFYHTKYTIYGSGQEIKIRYTLLGLQVDMLLVTLNIKKL